MRKLFFIFLLFSCIGVGPLSAETKSIRVTLEYDSKSFRVLHTHRFPGSVNRRKTPVEKRSDPFVFQVYSTDGSLLLEDSFRDPRLIYYDYPSEDGMLSGGTAELQSGVLTIVIPDDGKLDRIDFFDVRRGVKRNTARRIAVTDRIGSVRAEELKDAKQ